MSKEFKPMNISDHTSKKGIAAGTVGNVIIGELIHTPRGKSEFAATYRGTLYDQPVIVKHGSEEDLNREMAILSSVDYKGIPKVTSYTDNQQEKWAQLSMEVVPGESLDTFLAMDRQWKSEKIDLKPAAAITIELIRCFEAINNAGFLYRDLSPAHIIIDKKNGRYSVGLVDVEASARKDKDGDAKIIDKRGTWETMSPEEFEDNATISEASSVYSIGCILLQMLEGNSPFHASSELLDSDEERLLCKKYHQTIQPVITGPLRDVVSVALNPDIRGRYQTLGDFRDAIVDAI